ncbi:hypothetical protein [Nodosilinea sp. P-1105]|uniref:hypothetical protein n=1 Tax=Nodosilinea sp. P-1105 TaxID=2546229 RepID=UPI00146B5D01|nr:hypothetical protein [Nodosilinea sp. P-1105]NMF84296.1 hypothetical protein [Nodosilinea sp. P-1105]
MGIQLNHISGISLALVAAAAIAAPAGWAQEAPRQTIPDAMDELTSTYSGDFYRNRSISRQAARIVGFGFPEREIEWDSHATSAAVRDLMLLQTGVDPTLRVPDMATPFNTSLLTMPSSQAPAVGTEFIFERL